MADVGVVYHTSVTRNQYCTGDMTRTSLVDGITPFCFTCANNIRLVCRKCWETMALRV